MNIIVEYLTKANPHVLAISILLIILLVLYLLKNRKDIKMFFDDLYNKRKKKEELLSVIQKNQEEIKQLMENRLHDRQQSFSIQKELTDNQKELSDSISAISKKLDDMQKRTDERFKESEDKNNKRIRAELKDKIGQSYRYYHSKGKINDIELEALEGLITEYESAGGENSFVHTVVQKEMYTWEKVKRE